jgi:hypothetical protein
VSSERFLARGSTSCRSSPSLDHGDVKNPWLAMPSSSSKDVHTLALRYGAFSAAATDSTYGLPDVCCQLASRTPTFLE